MYNSVIIKVMRGMEQRTSERIGNSGSEFQLSSLSRNIHGIGGALIIASGVAFAASPAEAYTQPPVEQEHVMYIPARDLLVPPQIASETYSAVDTLLQAPEDPVIAPLTAQMRIVDLNILSNGNLMPFSDKSQEKLNAQVRTEVAAKTGLTVYDPTPITEKLRADLALSNGTGEYLGGSMHVSEYLSVAQEFASKYGVTLRFANETDNKATGFGFSDPKPIESYDNIVSKESLIDIIAALGALPKEAVTLAQLQDIVLYDGEAAQFGGFANSDRHSIAFGFGTRHIPKDAVIHEYGHLLLKVLNGQANRDPEYDKLGDGKTSQFTIAKRTNDLRSRQNEAIKSGDTAKACSIDAQILEHDKDVDAFSDYGTKSHDENLAEGVARLGTSTNYIDALSIGSSSKLYQRTRNIYARLYQSSKPLAEFFAKITPHAAKHVGPVTKACLTGNWSRFQK